MADTLKRTVAMLSVEMQTELQATHAVPPKAPIALQPDFPLSDPPPLPISNHGPLPPHSQPYSDSQAHHDFEVTKHEPQPLPHSVPRINMPSETHLRAVSSTAPKKELPIQTEDVPLPESHEVVKGPPLIGFGTDPRSRASLQGDAQDADGLSKPTHTEGLASQSTPTLPPDGESTLSTSDAHTMQTTDSQLATAPKLDLGSRLDLKATGQPPAPPRALNMTPQAPKVDSGFVSSPIPSPNLDQSITSPKPTGQGATLEIQTPNRGPPDDLGAPTIPKTTTAHPAPSMSPNSASTNPSNAPHDGPSQAPRPERPPHNRSRLAILTPHEVSDPNSSWKKEGPGGMCHFTKFCYAKLHGYKFILDTHRYGLEHKRLLMWNRIPSLQKHLPHYDWILYLDSDILIANSKTLLEDFVRQFDPEWCVVFMESVKGFNTGGFFIRNNPVSYQFLRMWWGASPDTYSWLYNDQVVAWDAVVRWFNTQGGKEKPARSIPCKAAPLETGARAWKSSIDCYVNQMKEQGAPPGKRNQYGLAFWDAGRMVPRGFNFFNLEANTRWLWPEHELYHPGDFVIHTHSMKVMLNKSEYTPMLESKCWGLMPDW
mmetsp:Transcript_8746/g.15623  ORF Transcript_8746/g.15623 Transcript_8746/m.15623 type:complete len:598 (-) Transcript_8746:69-1862(-)